MKSVRRVENESVYNLTVNNVHNISVSGGKILSNCDDLRYYRMSRPDPALLMSEGIKGYYAYRELVMKGFNDMQIRQLVNSGNVKLIGQAPIRRE